MTINKRLKRRVAHQVIISSISLLIFIIIYISIATADNRIQRISIVTAYISALLLTLTLSLGAWNILRHNVNPVSNDLRRDLGIWCGIYGLIHVLFGLNVHLQNWTQYFIDDSGQFLTNLFGFTNYIGVLASLILIILLATSNDFSLRYLGKSRWKTIQRWNYILVLLVTWHGFAYQIIEKRLIPFGFLLGTIILWIVTIQSVGFIIRRSETKRISLKN